MYNNVTVDLENSKKIIEEITDLLYGVCCKIYDITEKQTKHNVSPELTYS